MQLWKQLLCMFALAIGVIATGSAQVTITESDINQSFTNVSFQNQSDSLGQSINLGNASDGQTFDYSFIAYHAASTRLDTSNYYAPTGHVAVVKDSFPGATQVIYVSKTESAAGYLITISYSEYLLTTSNGVYLMGLVEHIVTTPTPVPGIPFPADSVIIVRVHPGPTIREFVLPLSGSTAMYTTADTSYNLSGNGSYTTEYKRSIPAGSGTMILPDRRSVSVVRGLEVDSNTAYNTGQSPTTDVETYVTFFGTDGEQMKFNVQNGVTGGAVVPKGYELTTLLGALAVRPSAARVPEQFNLSQNYPNPFNPATIIGYDLPKESFVRLAVFNILGQEVRVLVNRTETAGAQAARFDASGLPSGVYFYRLTAMPSNGSPAGSFTKVRKMILTK